MKVQPDATGPAAPPRRNGELIFEEPWESRAFGLAISLAEAGLLEWDELREQLMAEIGHWEGEHADVAAGDVRSPDEQWSYYERFLAGFERLLLEKGLVSGAELDARHDEFASGEREEVY